MTATAINHEIVTDTITTPTRVIKITQVAGVYCATYRLTKNGKKWGTHYYITKNADRTEQGEWTTIIGYSTRELLDAQLRRQFPELT